MPNLEDVRHDILLIITVAIFILFTTALAVPPTVPLRPIVIPS